MAEEKRAKDVSYELEVVDDLPPDENLLRRSMLRDQVAKVVGNPEYHGKYVRIANYGDKNSASGAATTLRYRHGDHPSIDGFTFRTKRDKVDPDNPNARTSLYMHYDPKAVEPGARELFEKKLKARQQKKEEKA